MHSLLKIFVFLVAITVPLSPAAQAGEPQPAPEETAVDEPLERPVPNQGHFVAVGAHMTGAMMRDEARGTRGPGAGYGFSLRLGESVTEKFDLGLAFDWGKAEGDADLIFGRLTIHTQYQLGRRWYALGGFGFAGVGGPDKEDPAYDRGSFGDVYLLGVGHNLFLTDPHKSGGWVLSPVLTFELLPHDGFRTGIMWFGLEISRWTGLRRDQLDLPTHEAYDSKKP